MRFRWRDLNDRPYLSWVLDSWKLGFRNARAKAT